MCRIKTGQDPVDLVGSRFESWVRLPPPVHEDLGIRPGPEEGLRLTLDLGPGFMLTMGRAMDGQAMTIGELAEACAVSRDTLRFYERERLLPPPKRSVSGYRLYQHEDASRVRFVRRAQSMGLTLDDIRELLQVRSLKTPEQCRRVAARLKARVADVDQKITELQAFREELSTGLKRCERAISRKECCPVVVALGANGARTG
jgi:DNA-binding transcriptional MerR regulator